MKKRWETKSLGDICDFEGGSQPPKSQFVYEEKRGYVRFIQIRDFGSDKNITYIPQAKKNRLCSEGDILIGRYGASVGKILTDKAGAYNVALMKTLPNLAVLNRSWFYNYLLSDEFQLRLLNVADRSAQAGFSKDDIYSFPVPLPSLAEQQRIVSILDEAFEGIATAKAAAEKNLQNARALFESHLQSVFTQRGKGWVETTLGEAYDVRDGTHDSPKYHATGFPLITSKNLKRDGLSFEDIKLINEKDFYEINKRSAVHKGDVLFAMIGTIGNPTLVEVEPRFAIKNVALLKVSQHQSGAFLRYYLGSCFVIDKMTREAKGTTQRFVGLGYLRGFPIHLPPLKTQFEVIKELDALSLETQRLARIYEQKLSALDSLKKSLLHQAFTGAL